MGKIVAGRPTPYKPEYADMARVACREGGFTMPSLAKLFKVHRDTIYEWKKKYPKFSDAITKGRDEFDVMAVEKCLMKRARGYYYTETVKDGGKDIVKTTRKHVPIDTTALTFFLKNRNPERWRDTQKVEHSGGVDTNVKIDPKEIKELMKEVLKDDDC